MRRCARVSAMICTAAVLALPAGCPCGTGRPSIQVDAPAYGDKWLVGSTKLIWWHPYGLVETVRIELLRGGAEPAEVIAEGLDASASPYAWTVTGPEAEDCVIRVCDASDPAVRGSSGPFDVVGPGMHLLAPLGWETWIAGREADVSWVADAALAAGITWVNVELSRDGGTTWSMIVASADAAAGATTWLVTEGTGERWQRICRVRVSDAGDPAANDVSDDDFTIVVPKALRVDGRVAAPGDGLTWASAFRRPQDAVNAAIPDDEIWVATGLYHSRAPSAEAVVVMKEDVDLYGGFQGTESARADRDWVAHATTLDGEDAAQHVVVGASRAALDGFTVTGGVAEGLGGGGYYGFRVEDIVVANCTFVGNEAVYPDTGTALGWGGGLLVSAGSGLVVDCSFLINTATECGGGAAVDGGYAVPFGFGPVVFRRCEFFGNSARRGGGLYHRVDGPVEECTFELNYAAYGGGAYLIGFPSVTRCRFYRNGSEALSCVNQPDMQVTNCLFVGGGPGLDVRSSQGSVRGCTFWDDSASLSVRVLNSGSADLVNCILWRPAATGQLYVASGSAAAVSYSDVSGGFAGPGNIDADPLFVDPQGAGGDFGLQAGSPCIDAGDPATTLAVDIDGNPRPALSGYDMGAHERQ